MSIIAVDRIPPFVSLKFLVKELKKPIRGAFEALNFRNSIKSNQMKMCYIQLSEQVDPVHAVQNINNSRYKSRGRYYAFIPDNVPDMPSVSMKTRMKRSNPAMRKKLLIARMNANGQIFKVTTDEIINEMQAKYPGLYGLSKKYDHKVLQEIAKTVFSRVKEVVSGPELEESCFKATRAYRRAYPHTGDFQLVLSTIHAVEDAAGIPRMQLQESDLMAVSSATQAQDLPKENIKALCDKFTSKIGTKMAEHINNLDVEINATDSELEIAKKKVRQELKKLQPFLNSIISQVISQQFLSPWDNTYRMRVYGEPTLPNKETLMPFLARFHAKNVMRSMKMYNLVMMNVIPQCYQQLVEMHGTVLNGSKLMIASSDMVLYKASSSSLKGSQGEADPEDESMDEEQEHEFWEDEAH